MIETGRLTGDDLTVADVWAVAVEGRPVALADSARERMTRRPRARRAAPRTAARSTRTASTPASAASSRSSIPEELTEELQLRLLRSHACGVGEPYPHEIVRAAMLLRANALAKGYSGARPETVELLVECLNRGLLPHVPSRGSVGASGDLAPLAHLALPLIGEGEAWSKASGSPGAEALERAGLEPIRLQAKEGLSLVNGTQFMAALAALGLIRADRLANTADIACALSLEALQGSRTSFLPQIQALRPLPGQAASAANVLQLLEDSAINEAHRWCDQVQDAYSLRCAPQVHGASRDLLDYVRQTVSIELNAATDNPLVLVEDEMLVSNGNFHGQPLALRARRAGDGGRGAREHRRAARRAARQPEPLRRPARVPDRRRRAQLRLHDPAVRRRLARQREQGARAPGVGRLDPDERRPGGSRLDGQCVRAEGVAGARRTSSACSRSSCSPARRASSSSRRSQPGVGVRAAREHVRSLSPRLRDDRTLAGDIEAVAASIRDGSLVGAVEAEVGELA